MDVDELILGGSIYAYFEYKKIFVDAEVEINTGDIDSWSNNVTNIKVTILSLDVDILKHIFADFYRFYFG